MGSEYSNEDEPDAVARVAADQLTDASVLSVPGVTAWTRGNAAFACAKGYELRSGTVPYGNRGVVVITHDEELGSRADEILRLHDGELV